MLGILFIVIGSILLLENFGFIHYGFISWPITLLLTSLGFHIAFFLTGKRPENAGLLVPGGILLILSIYFYIDILTNYQYTTYTWPTIILAPAFGLFELWYFGGRNKGLWVPISVLTIVAALFYAQAFLAILLELWPIALIAVGIYFIFGKKQHKQ
ncbi:membrane protein [Pontibacillus litoralis JSM 072002]|uniref:Membrane protein n=1 Tax=Pontibacillus litoralis JSM 072002 TaxID=1385512 RepID=A0A0A5HTX3_9BACI|nr:membrane protein [Pontibacillus litoralis JSM 072002]